MNTHCHSICWQNARCLLYSSFHGCNLSLFSLTRAVGKIGSIESDMAPSIITVTSADESDVDITEAVEKSAGTD